MLQKVLHSTFPIRPQFALQCNMPVMAIHTTRVDFKLYIISGLLRWISIGGKWVWRHFGYDPCFMSYLGAEVVNHTRAPLSIQCYLFLYFYLVQHCLWLCPRTVLVPRCHTVPLLQTVQMKIWNIAYTGHSAIYPLVRAGTQSVSYILYYFITFM